MTEFGPYSISACLAVRNEEAVLGRCLESVKDVVDEIVVVHDGDCSDRSVEIAEHYGARVLVRPWTGNPELQTVFAYRAARGAWVLNLDADEYLSSELRSELRGLVRRSDVDGYAFLWRM